MEPQRLSSLVAAARNGDHEARVELLASHRVLIQRTASRISGRSLDWQNDDDLSVAMIAFNEAIDGYDGRRGASFLTYAITVIRYRLLDYFRRERRHASFVPLETSDDDLEVAPAEIREAWARFEAEQEEARTAEEVDILTSVLQEYGFDLSDLVASSPKHQDTKQTMLRVVRTLLERPHLMAYLQRTRQLPLKELEQVCSVSRKVLENGRRYIVATAIIMQHPDLPRIRAHIQLIDRSGVTSDE